MTKTVDELEKEIILLKNIIRSLVLWMAGSANSPISQREASTLIQMMEESETKQ